MTDQNPVTHVRSWVALICAWAALNCALIVIDVNPDAGVDQRPPRPSRLALKLFEPHSALHNEAADRSDCRLSFRLLQPRQDGSVRRFPLLIFLHGAGERGSDNESQLLGLPAQMCLSRWRRQFPCYLLAPQCPQGRHWSDSIADLETMTNDICKSYSVDQRRVYLTGLSAGGFGSWELAARHPDLFAAVVPICGGGEPEWCQALAMIPNCAVHGADDAAVLPERSRAMIEGIREAGGRPRTQNSPASRTTVGLRPTAIPRASSPG